MNIKFIIGVFLITFYSLTIQAQKLDFSELNLVRIHSLDSLSNVEQLKEAFEDKRIVLLGEQTHGEGSTFDAKVTLIKLLHQELDFDIVAFESGLYSNYKAGEIDKVGNPIPSTYYESVSSIWSDTRQFHKLLSYVKETQVTDKPLKFAGFDFLEGQLFKEYFFDDLLKVFNKNGIQLNDNTINILKDTFFGDVDYIATRQLDSLQFYSAVQKIGEGFNKVKPTEHSRILHQSFKSYLASVNWAVDNFKDKDYKVQNPRDLQMAKNLIFLANLYPDKKIIGWGASYHFANQIQKYQNTDLTRKYINDMLEENETQDLDSSLNGAVPMGKILKKYFKEELYSLAFSSYEGTYGLVGNEPDTLLTPPPVSLEYVIAKRGYDFAFINYPQDLEGKFYSSPLGNVPIMAPWQNLFDGLFFIRSSYHPEFLHYSESDLKTEKKQSNVNIIGRIIDSKNNQPVPYAHISLLNTSKGTVSNDEGIFNINISGADISDSLLFSSVGYKKHKIDIKNYTDTLEIELIQEATLLNEVVISGKSLSAKQIVKKAKKSIGSNYYQRPYNQELFYRVQRKDDDSITFNEEASILVYDKSGYQPSNRAYRNFYGQILQFRNSTENPEKHKWDGVGSIWLVFSHDLVFDKDNVLHRRRAYDLEITNIIPYKDKMVYEIKFINKRPSAYTTGYGYPAPESSHGKLYIDTQSYAILKYEHCIERKDSKVKKDSEYQTVNNKIQLIQTYSEFDNYYFLTFSKQIMTGTSINLDSKDSTDYFQSFDLLSTDIVTDLITELQKPIDKLKVGMKIKEDKEFWDQHNYVIEDKNRYLNICDK